ncbi:MAG: endonuclease MutS2, partial [Acidobacteria bacterium]|nr:endonuclease MutS2 [Acidobacteriota bacterium]
MATARIPGKMATDTLDLLEFTELLSLVGNYVGSPLGKAKLASVAPCTDVDTITARQRLAAEAGEYLRSSMGSPAPTGKGGEGTSSRTLPLNFSAFTDPEPSLQKVSVEGTILEIPEITDLLAFAERASDIKRALLACEHRFPHLGREAARIGDFHSLLRGLSGKILPSGELSDHASLELNRIRREIEKQRTLILSSLRNFLRTQPEESPLQEEIITIRGERFVVPVRVTRKNRVQGVVHGASSSGQTVYMEPLETIDLNNELVRLKEEEEREIRRILQQMTARLRQQAPELSETADCIGVLELAFGCGRFALDYDCIIPRISSNPSESASLRLVLKDARHPLLQALLRRRKVPVVPLSLALEGENRVLVISGPNTGGKTVALKTAGLLALMAMSGLPVPAAEAEFPLFDRILADIGDYQSIQENLSTFSAHLLNISSMMASVSASASRDSLVLLDELGSATDPEEAGALGVAVVDRFHSAGAFTIVSTHHMVVKAFATNTPGILSASMGFDEQTLQPTYGLEMGAPGKSSGLAIAQRLGLPPEVLERARQALTSAHLEVEQFLLRLKEQEAAATQARAELEGKLAALALEEKQWKEGLRRQEQQRTAEWERQLEELARNFEEQAEQKLREIASRPTSSSRRLADAKREAARMGSRFREQVSEELRQAVVSHLGETEGALSAPQTGVAREPLVGERVRLKGLGQWGIVRRKEQDSLEVEIG